MKQLFPVFLALLAAACAPPKPGTSAHQRLLEKEARENFYALKEKERKSAPPAAVARTERPAKVRLRPFKEEPVATSSFAFSDLFAARESSPTTPSSRARPTPAPKRSKPMASTASLNPFARLEHSRRDDDTVYYYDVKGAPEPSSPRYRAYKARYARELAKRPEDLTSEEREWVRRHYRD